MTASRGYSGACIQVVGDRVFKTGPSNPLAVVQQGRWLVDNEGVHLPVVHEILMTGYTMELLQPIPTGEAILEVILRALEDSVWKHGPEVQLDTPLTMLYVSRILDKYAPDLAEPILSRIAYIRPTDDCLTHGDPTAENVMLRGETYVLIDPIPAKAAIPHDKAVDVGKILQSAYGWEAMRGEEPATFTPDLVRQRVSGLVWDVAQLWALVHFVRVLPYATEEVRARVIHKLEELLGFRC